VLDIAMIGLVLLGFLVCFLLIPACDRLLNEEECK
jgi:hypothetical protein